MRILILTNYANGLYLFRKELIKAFVEDGHEVIVSVPFDKNCYKLEDLGVELIYTSLDRHGINPIKDLQLLLEYRKLIKIKKPGIILTYTIKPNIYGATAARLSKVPYICNITGLGTAIENGGFFSKILLRMYAFSMYKAKKVFFQNERNCEFMRSKGVAIQNYAILPGSGVNLTEHPYREYPSEADGIKFLAVIRIMKDKGIEEYLNAAEIISSKYENVKFELVGEYEEDERQKYEPRINEFVNKGFIKYYGHLDSVEPVMSNSHVIVHPSYHEGLSNVLLEAAACGRPVIATNIHGCIETFDNNISGYAIDRKDTDSLVQAIETVLSLSEEDRRKMGIHGRKWVEERFDRNIVIDAYRKEIY